jgi:hypothetical protein
MPVPAAKPPTPLPAKSSPSLAGSCGCWPGPLPLCSSQASPAPSARPDHRDEYASIEYASLPGVIYRQVCPYRHLTASRVRAAIWVVPTGFLLAKVRSGGRWTNLVDRRAAMSDPYDRRRPQQRDWQPPPHRGPYQPSRRQHPRSQLLSEHSSAARLRCLWCGNGCAPRRPEPATCRRQASRRTCTKSHGAWQARRRLSAEQFE